MPITPPPKAPPARARAPSLAPEHPDATARIWHLAGQGEFPPGSVDIRFEISTWRLASSGSMEPTVSCQDKAADFILKNLLIPKASKIKDMFKKQKTKCQVLFGTAEQAALWAFFASSGLKMEMAIDWCVLANPETPPRLMHTQSPMSDFYVMPVCDWDEKLLVRANVIFEFTMIEALQQHVDHVAKQSNRAELRSVEREIEYQESRLAHGLAS